jgi:hypothetical protein
LADISLHRQGIATKIGIVCAFAAAFCCLGLWGVDRWFHNPWRGLGLMGLAVAMSLEPLAVVILSR